MQDEEADPTVLQSMELDREEDVKIDASNMFKIDFSHLENIMQGF